LSEFSSPASIPPLPRGQTQKELGGQTCDLCGLPAGRSNISPTIAGAIYHFCCPGCAQVFLILFNRPGGKPENFRDTELYRACVRAGMIPKSREGLLSPEADSLKIEEPKFPPPLDLSLDLNLQIRGMWCPACSWLIEEVLRRTPGILEPRVSFLSDRVELKYLPHLLSPAEVMEKIARLGYHPSLQLEGEASSREKKDLLVRLGVSAILAVNIMMISFALYSGFFRDLPAAVVAYFSYPLWLMATLALFYGGLPILRKGLAGLLHRRPTMESLIAIASLSAYFYSVYRMSQGSLYLYFDTSSMLITLVLLGRWIEIHIRGKVAAGITGLHHLTRTKVRFLDRGGERWVSSDALSPGDSFLVSAGERVPLDGEVLEGRGDMDESILTGEARPVPKRPGEGVKAGSLLLGGEMKVRATRVGRESSLGQVAALMQAALDMKNPAELMADRITRWFVPAILAMAGATFFSLWLLSFPEEEALLRSLTVLVIACPCALGIAIPIVKLASVGLARSKGILVREPAALEAAKDLDVLVFDKTGTLTEGNFRLQEMVTDEETEPGQALFLIASVEALSGHFLARETLRKAREKSLRIEKAEDFEALEGRGVKGRVGSVDIFIGNRKWMGERNVGISPAQGERAREAEAQGRTVVFAGWGGRVHSLLLFGDSLRPGIQEMVEALHARGIETWIVSGDSQATTRSVAHQCGIPEFRGETLPQDKAQLIKDLQSKGRRVGMIGDGINDAAALAQADVGFALGTGTRLFQEASDITFLVPDPSRVIEALDLSRRTVRTVRQNLFFAFLYNSVAIPLAVAGWLNPLIAVFAMFASSLTVTGNAWRMTRARDPERAVPACPGIIWES